MLCVIAFFVCNVLGTVEIASHVEDHFFDLSEQSSEYVIPVTTFSSTVGDIIEMSISSPPSWVKSKMVNPTSVGVLTLNGDSYCVFVEGNYAYVAEDVGGLRVIDISSKENPIYVGGYDTEGSTRYVVVESGKYAYIADGMSGVKILDVSNKENMILVSDIPLDGSSVHVLLDGDYIYVATRGFYPSDNGVVVVNVNQKASPYVVDRIWTNNTMSLFLKDEILFIADGIDGLLLVDVSVKSNIKIVGSFPSSDDAVGVTDVFVVGNYAYLTEWSVGVVVVDVSDIRNPSFFQNFTTVGSASGIDILGTVAFVSTAFDSGLRVFDISSPSNPQLIGSKDTYGSAYNVLIRDPYAYVADGREGVIIMDISTPSNLTVVGNVDTNGVSKSVFVKDDYAYLADNRGGLEIVNIHNPSYPKLFGSISLEGDAYDAYVEKNTCYVAGGMGGLQIVDVTKKNQPKLIKSLSFSGVGEASRIAFSSNCVYLLNVFQHSRGKNSSLSIIDVSTPSTPNIIGSFNEILMVAFDIKVSSTNNHVYVVGRDGLIILDVTTKSSPSIISSLQTIGSSVSVSLQTGSEEYLYVATASGTFLVIDIRTKTTPKVITTFQSGSSCIDMFVTNNKFAVLGDGMMGQIVLLDISNHTTPKIIGTSLCVGNPEGLFIKENRIYVAGETTGIQIFRFGDLSVKLSQPSDIFCGNVSISVTGKELTTTSQTSTSSKLYCNDVCPTSTEMKGTCDSPNSNLCKCDSPTEWYGIHCDKYYCFGRKYDDGNVCSGNGVCISPDNCECEKGKFYGRECENKVKKNQVGVIVGVVLGVGLPILIVCATCLIVCIILIVLVVVGGVIILVKKSDASIVENGLEDKTAYDDLAITLIDHQDIDGEKNEDDQNEEGIIQ